MSSNKRGSKRKANVVASGDSGRRRGADGAFISTPIQVGNIDATNTSSSTGSTTTTDMNTNNNSSSSTSSVAGGTSGTATTEATITPLSSSLAPLPQGTTGNRINIHDDSDDEFKDNDNPTSYNNSRSNYSSQWSSGSGTGSNSDTSINASTSEGNKLLHQIWHIRLVPDHAPKLGGTSAAEFNSYEIKLKQHLQMYGAY